MCLYWYSLNTLKTLYKGSRPQNFKPILAFFFVIIPRDVLRISCVSWVLAEDAGEHF